MAKKQTYLSCLDTLKPVRDTLEVINGKWKLPIIISVLAGNKRFTDIQNSIPGITPKVLAKELKDLEEHQLIKRTVIDDFPVKILYQPDIHVNTLIPIIDALKDWGIKHREKLFLGKELESNVS